MTIAVDLGRKATKTTNLINSKLISALVTSNKSVFSVFNATKV